MIAWLLARPKLLLGGLAVLALASYVGLLQAKLRRAEAEAAAERLARLNLAAEGDTTRQIFRDSLAGVERLVVQLRRKDLVGNARLAAQGRELAANAGLLLVVDSLRALVTRPVAEDSLGTRTSDFAADSGGLHVRATVTVPPPPGLALWRVNAWLDSASLALELSCRSDVAEASVVGPSWLTVNLTRVEQDAAICVKPRSAPVAWWRRLGLGVGVGYGVLNDGTWHQGWTALAGVLVRF